MFRKAIKPVWEKVYCAALNMEVILFHANWVFFHTENWQGIIINLRIMNIEFLQGQDSFFLAENSVQKSLAAICVCCGLGGQNYMQTYQKLPPPGPENYHGTYHKRSEIRDN